MIVNLMHSAKLEKGAVVLAGVSKGDARFVEAVRYTNQGNLPISLTVT